MKKVLKKKFKKKYLAITDGKFENKKGTLENYLLKNERLNTSKVVPEGTKNSKYASLAEELELSKDYIGKLFKNKIGITLNEYSTILKMEYGKKLLKTSNKKVYEISEELGYSTVDYFSKLFKNYTNLTPVQYRKKSLV